MTISEMEVATGLDRATIRFYEKQGLLCPRRLENGYRDYSDEDRQTLLRIKLLRELGVGLEEIRALQQGTAALPETLAARLEALELEFAATVQARDTCRAIRDTGVSYQALDAEQYLGRPSWTMPPVHDAPPIPYCPWRRYLARTFDWTLYELLLIAVLTLGFHVNLTRSSPWLSVGISFLALGVMLLAEPLFLVRFGTTPGKAIFGLRVERQDGGRLTYADAMSRTWDVIALGLGYNIPFYNLYRLFRSYKAHTEGEEQPWDLENDFCLQVKPGAWWRNAVFVAAAAAQLALEVLCNLAAAFPPHFGPLTTAEFAENYNFVASFYRNSPDMLDGSGQWVREDGVIYLDNGSGLPAVTLETGADGAVEAVTLDWQYDETDWLISWPADKMQYAALALAASDGGWWDYWGKRSVVDIPAAAPPFESGSRSGHGLDFTWEVEQAGFEDAGSGYLYYLEDGSASCTVRFTVRLGT